MFRRKFYLICLVIALLFVVKLALGAPTEEWKVKMRNLASALNQLLPDVSSKAQFDKANPKTAAKIEELNKALAAVQDELPHHAKQKELSADPMYAAVLNAFRDDVSTAMMAYKAGRVDYAKTLIRNSVTYCTSCHTRHENQSKFEFPIFAEGYNQLSLTEKMKLLAASRQFDQALDLYEANADYESMKKFDNFELEGATRLAIAIMVRVKQKPDPALAIIDHIKERTQREKEFYKELDGWAAALKEWKAEKPIALKTEDDYRKRIESLMKQARSRQDYPFDEKADVDYLRATSLMHTYLEKFPKSKNLSLVLLNLGKAYEVLQDLGFWSLHEFYYESCIRRAPGTETAKECYSRFEDSTVMGYTGSAGTKVPPEIKRKLDELKSLAFGT